MRRRVTLNDESWVIDDRAKMRVDWGRCKPASNEILICRSAVPAGIYREVLIHECLHALFPFLDEAYVDEAAIELEEVLKTFEGRGDG